MMSINLVLLIALPIEFNLQSYQQNKANDIWSIRAEWIKEMEGS